MSSSGGGLGLSTSTSSFSDLFGGSDDIFAGLDSISTTSSPRDNDFLSLSLPGSARNSIIGDDSTTRNSLSFTNLNATSTSTSSTPTGVASPSGIASAFRSLSYSNPAAPTTPTATTSTTTSASATNSATTSPRSSIQFPRFGSLSRTVNNASRDAGVSSNLASGGGSIERSLSPTSPTLREGTPVPPARNSTKSVVASSGIGILSSGSAAAAAMITGKALPTPEPNRPTPLPARVTQPGDDDHQPTKKSSQSGQIVNARSLVEENDTMTSVGSAGFVPTGSQGDLYEGTTSASMMAAAAAGGSPLGRRVPGPPGKDKSSVERRSTATPSSKSKSSDNVNRDLHVRDASKAQAFESLLTTGTTVKLSSTPDRLRTLEVTGARKNSAAPKYQAKDATVAMKEDHALSEFLKNTGPGDDMRSVMSASTNAGGVLKNGGANTGSAKPSPSISATTSSEKPLKGVLKSSSSLPPVPTSSSPSRPSTTPPTPTSSTPDLTAPPPPPIPRSTSAPKKLDDSDSDDELFGRPKKKKDEMSLADFLKYSEPPPEPTPPSSPLPKKTRKDDGPLRLFSLNRSRTNSNPPDPVPPKRSRNTSDASVASKESASKDPIDDTPNRNRSASQSSMERLVKSMFSGFGGNEDEPNDSAAGATSGEGYVAPPVPVIPPEILAKHHGKPTQTTPASPKIEKPIEKPAVTIATSPEVSTPTSPTPVAVAPVVVQRTTVVTPSRFTTKPNACLTYTSTTSSSLPAQFSLARTALMEVDGGFSVLEKVSEEALMVPGGEGDVQRAVLREYKSFGGQTEGEGVEMGCQTIYDVLVVEYEEYLYGEEEEEVIVEESEGEEEVKVLEEDGGVVDTGCGEESRSVGEDATVVAGVVDVGVGEDVVVTETRGVDTGVGGDVEDVVVTEAKVVDEDVASTADDYKVYVTEVIEETPPTDDLHVMSMGTSTPESDRIQKDTSSIVTPPATPDNEFTDTPEEEEEDVESIARSLVLDIIDRAVSTDDTAVPSSASASMCDHCHWHGRKGDTVDGEMQTTPFEHVREVGVQVCTMPVVPMPMSPGSPMMAGGQYPFVPSSRYSLPPGGMAGLAAALKGVGSSVGVQAGKVGEETQTRGVEFCGQTEMEVKDFGGQVGESGEEVERERMESEERMAMLVRRVRELEEENEVLRKGMERERGMRRGVVEVLVGVVDLCVKREVKDWKEVEELKKD